MPVAAPGAVTLLETLVAAAILASALGALVPVFGVALRAGDETRAATSEIVLATQALEMVRAAAYEDQVPGEFVEYLDAAGRSTDDTVSDGTPAFVRRLSISPLEWDPDNTIVIRASVSRYPRRVPAPSDVNLVTLKTRK